jgi:hypothetical protein
MRSKEIGRSTSGLSLPVTRYGFRVRDPGEGKRRPEEERWRMNLDVDRRLDKYQV